MKDLHINNQVNRWVRELQKQQQWQIWMNVSCCCPEPANVTRSLYYEAPLCGCLVRLSGSVKPDKEKISWVCWTCFTLPASDLRPFKQRNPPFWKMLIIPPVDAAKVNSQSFSSWTNQRIAQTPLSVRSKGQILIDWPRKPLKYIHEATGS